MVEREGIMIKQRSFLVILYISKMIFCFIYDMMKSNTCCPCVFASLLWKKKVQARDVAQSARD